jgi:hypothetical protein
MASVQRTVPDGSEVREPSPVTDEEA